MHSLNKQESTKQRHANAKPMKDKKKKRKRKYYERITMQAERTHTYKQRTGDKRVENEEAYAINGSEK